MHISKYRTQFVEIENYNIKKFDLYISKISICLFLLSISSWEPLTRRPKFLILVLEHFEQISARISQIENAYIKKRTQSIKKLEHLKKS